MALRIEASRLLLHKAASLKDKGEEKNNSTRQAVFSTNSTTLGASYSTSAAMAKLYASETATFVAHQSIQACSFKFISI